jgi:hypothetical protein
VDCVDEDRALARRVGEPYLNGAGSAVDPKQRLGIQKAGEAAEIGGRELALGRRDRNRLESLGGQLGTQPARDRRFGVARDEGQSLAVLPTCTSERRRPYAERHAEADA